MPFRSEAQRKMLHMTEPGVAAEMEAKMPPGKKLPKHTGDEMPEEESGEMKIPGPDEIDAAIDGAAKEVDRLRAKVGGKDAPVDDKGGDAPRTMRMLAMYGPPEEWSASDMKLLGDDKCAMLKAAWDKLDDDKKAMILKEFEGKEHAPTGEPVAVPMAAVTITKEM